MLGVAGMLFIVFFQNLTNTDEHNSQLLKETTEAAMWDAVDYAYFRTNGDWKINKEKFVENFIRRYAENAQMSRNYKIQFYDINELPPKVSIRVTTNLNSGSITGTMGKSNNIEFTVSHKIDAILETPY